MTPATLAVTLARIGWSRRELARRLGYRSEASIRQWRTVPTDVAAWLIVLADAIDGMPSPRA